MNSSALVRKPESLDAASARLALLYYAQGSGGTAYERQLFLCLKDALPIQEHAIRGPSNWPRWLRTPAAVLDLHRSVRATSSGYDLVIDTLNAALLRRGGTAKNLVIVHHLDFSTSRHARLYSFLGGYILQCLRRAGQVVVVSEFWKRYLENRGVEKVELIYNPFPLEEFRFPEDELNAFKHRLGLLGKPIIYLGNRTEGKGVDEAYRTLKGIDAHFIATGKDARLLSCPRTECLSARDYQLLLKASSLAVTMSTFDEGWCRNAHEAMLCKTPVVGSGRGGMGELLTKGKQVLCRRFEQLAAEVSGLLADPVRRRAQGEEGFAFASRFTLDRFRSAWLRVLEQSAALRS